MFIKTLSSFNFAKGIPMKRHILRHMLPLLAASCMFTSAKADVITVGCELQANQACRLSELLTVPNASIQIDGARFHNFSEFNIPLDVAERIRVSAIDGIGGGSQPGNVVGLEFTPIEGLETLLEGFSLDDFNLLRDIMYDIQVVSGLKVGASDMSVRFGDMVFSSGFMLEGGLAKFIDRPGLASVFTTATCGQVSVGDFTCAGETATRNVTFGPVASLSITDRLFIDHEGGFGGRADGLQIISFRQAFFRVPEPGSMALLAIGTVGLAWVTRRRRLQRR